MHEAIVSLTYAAVYIGAMMAFGIWLGSVGFPGGGAAIISMILFFGGGFVAIQRYEAWKKALPSPVLAVPTTIRQGEYLTVDLRFDAHPIELVEVVAAERRTGRDHEGRKTITDTRLGALGLTDRSDSASEQRTFDGRVPNGVRAVGVKWFVGVHIRHSRFFTYVRAYPVEVQR